MNALDLMNALEGVRDGYVLNAEELRQNHGRKGITLKRLWLAAAIIVLMLLLVGCAVVYVLNLQDMRISEEHFFEAGYTAPDGEIVPATEWITTYYSIQGYNESPHQKAMREWLDYLACYDQDDSLMKANNMNESGLPENYYITYSCYTWEMKDKLDQILKKYDLDALGKYIYIDNWEIDILFDSLQIDSLFCDISSMKSDRMAGYFTPEGVFKTEFRMEPVEQEELWPYDIVVSYRYSLTDYLDPVYGGVQNIDTVEQWHYALEDGTQLLLVLDGTYSMILCEQEDAFISIHMDDFSDQGGLSKADLERIAACFDYAIDPQQADMESVEKRLAASEEPYDPSVHGYYIGFIWNPDSGEFSPPEEYSRSIEQYLSYVQQNGKVENQFYALADVNGDGNQELLFGNQNGQLYELVYWKDDMVTIQFLTYLCEGNVLERYDDNDIYYFDDETYEEGCRVHEYRTTTDFLLKLCYLPRSDQWILSSSDKDAVISQSEALQIMSQYPRKTLDMKPIADYPFAP